MSMLPFPEGQDPRLPWDNMGSRMRALELRISSLEKRVAELSARKRPVMVQRKDNVRQVYHKKR